MAKKNRALVEKISAKAFRVVVLPPRDTYPVCIVEGESLDDLWALVARKVDVAKVRPAADAAMRTTY